MTKYFRAIDGLRAIAVLLVLFYHAGFDFARGGFVGVDVFFVISGFLITGIIIGQIENNRWSFSSFYLRRIARLIPALLVVILGTLIAGYIILPPDDLARLGQVSLYTAVSGSNFFFWLESGYFDQSASTKPLLHTWSLGVEEQFYLVWPLLVALLAKIGGRKAVAGGLAILGVLSLVAALAFSNKASDAVFYLMPFRIHQFALGGLIALLLSVQDQSRRTPLGLIAVVGLFALANLVSGETSAYWLSAALPALAAAVLIWSSETAMMRSLIGSAPLVWLGERSYAIYLVHWPLMVLWPMASDYDLSSLDGVAAIAGSVFLGALLHHTVEKPLRFKSHTTQAQKSKTFAITAALLVVVSLGGAHFWALDGVPSRIPAEMRQYANNQKAQQERQRQVRSGICNLKEGQSVSEYNVRRCATPDQEKPSYMVIGDSHGAGAYIILKKAYPEIHFGQFTAPGCFLKVPGSPPPEQRRQECSSWYDEAFRLSIDRGFDGVVFAASWKPYHRDKYDDMAEWAQSNNLDAVFFSHRPKFRDRAPAIAVSSRSIDQAHARANNLHYPYLRQEALNMGNQLSKPSKFVNLFEMMCPEECVIFNEGKEILYFDDSHLSLDGVTWLAERLRQNYPDLFAASES